MAEELIELGRKCAKGKIWRDGYRRKDGTKVRGKCVKDMGKPGETPAHKRVLPKLKEGGLRCSKTGKDWSHKNSTAKNMAILRCRVLVDGDTCTKVGRKLNALATYTETTSPETHRKARADMKRIKKQSWCTKKRAKRR